MAGLGGWFVDGKYFKQAVFGAEDVRESFLLESRLTLHHAFLTARAGHLNGLICKRNKEHVIFDLNLSV